MTAPSLHPEQPPRTALSAPGSVQDPASGTERRPGGEFGSQAGAEHRELLRERIAAAIDTHGLIHLDARIFGDHACCVEAILAVIAQLAAGPAATEATEPGPCPACRRADQAGLAADELHPECTGREQP